MGGFGSGRHREGNRGTVESYRWIDIGALIRIGSLWTRWWKVLEWAADNGRPVARIAIRAEGDHVVLSYRIGRDARPIEDTIAVTDIACHYGLGRPYFVCSGLDLNHPCGRLVRRLYLVDQLFRCRHCYRLTYASCSETATDRAHRRANAIRRRLGGRTGIAYPFPFKPRRMWQRTFDRLRQKALAAERQAKQALVDEFGSIRKRARR